MTQITVGGSQGAHLVVDSLTGVSSKGKAIPSSALELRHLNSSVTFEAKSCLLAGLAAPQPFAGLGGSSSPAGLPLPGRESLDAWRFCLSQGLHWALPSVRCCSRATFISCICSPASTGSVPSTSAGVTFYLCPVNFKAGTKCSEAICLWPYQRNSCYYQ